MNRTCGKVKYTGFLIMIVFGRYGGFHTTLDFGIHLCLGWVAITLIPLDVEMLLEDLMKEHKEIEKAGKKCLN